MREIGCQSGQPHRSWHFFAHCQMSLHDPVTHKIVIIGDSDVGKTSIIQRYDQQTFDVEMTPTVGASFLSKTVSTSNGPVVLNIWDTAGQERYRSLFPMYGRGARAAILCYDVSSMASFESLNSWLEELQKLCSPDCLLFVVGNKIDLESHVPQPMATQWANEHNAQCLFTSARAGEGVVELFKAIAESLAVIGDANEMPRLKVRREREGCAC